MDKFKFTAWDLTFRPNHKSGRMVLVVMVVLLDGTEMLVVRCNGWCDGCASSSPMATTWQPCLICSSHIESSSEERHIYVWFFSSGCFIRRLPYLYIYTSNDNRAINGAVAYTSRCVSTYWQWYVNETRTRKLIEMAEMLNCIARGAHLKFGCTKLYIFVTIKYCFPLISVMLWYFEGMPW